MSTTPTPNPLSKEAKPRYKVIALAAHEDAANAALVAAAKDGYPTLVNVYVVTTPSSSGTAFAILEQ